MDRTGEQANQGFRDVPLGHGTGWPCLTGGRAVPLEAFEGREGVIGTRWQEALIEQEPSEG